MKKQRTVVVRDRATYYYCREAIGGEYFNTVAKMYDKIQATELNEAADLIEGSIIVRFGDSRWAITTKGPDAIKSIRAECTNLTDAKEMVT